LLVTPACARSTPSEASDAPPDWLVDVTLGELEHNDPQGPTTARWALTDASEASEALLGSRGGSGSGETYVVILDGHFTDRYAHAPSGGDPPTGTHIVFLTDPQTHMVAAFEISSRQLNTSGLDLAPMDLPHTVPA